MRVALLIAQKDLRQRMRDKSAFLYGIVAPLGLAFIFSFVFNPIQDATFHATYVVVDQDGGPIAEALSEALGGLEDQGIATIRQVASAEEARRQVEAGSGDVENGGDGDTADAAFLIPPGFSEQVISGRGGEITVVGAIGSRFSAQVAHSIAQSFASELEAVEVAVRTVATQSGATDPQAIAALSAAAAQTANPIELHDITATTRQLSATTYMAAGMAVFFLFFTVSFGVSSLIEEKRLGTMDRMLAAPISYRSILGAKAITSFVLGVVSMTVLVVATTLLLGADWGHPLGVAMLIVAAVFSAMGILAVVGAIAKTPEQAENAQSIVTIVLAFMGGTFFSLAQAGEFMQTLSLLTPHAWFLRGLGDLQSGQVTDVLPSVGALLLFGLVTGSIAWVFLVRAVRR